MAWIVTALRVDDGMAWRGTSPAALSNRPLLCFASASTRQALPYSWTLFYVPMHFLTHEMLLFFTSIWTTNIHDNLHAKVGSVVPPLLPSPSSGWTVWGLDGLDFGAGPPTSTGGTPGWVLAALAPPAHAAPRPTLPPSQIAPVMGAGYHTIHHTLYNYNYGHYFTFVDR